MADDAETKAQAKMGLASVRPEPHPAIYLGSLAVLGRLILGGKPWLAPPPPMACGPVASSPSATPILPRFPAVATPGYVLLVACTLRICRPFVPRGALR
jgi:hypothetical protein